MKSTLGRKGVTLAALVLLVGTLVVSPAAGAVGQATQLPLSAWLSAQGKHVTYVPPVPDYIGWTGRPPNYPHLGSIDYAGLANAWLVANGGTSVGTQISGSFLKRDLGNNTVQYELDLLTTNAISYMLPNPSNDQVNDPLLFGARAQDIKKGARAALGECHLRWVWREDAGGFIPDFAELIQAQPNLPPGFAPISIVFTGRATGALHSLAGLGPEGTPGEMIITEVGLFMTSFRGATADGFPAELVDLHAIGQ